jgi:hypothetical protein
MPDEITAPITITQNVISAPLTIGFEGTGGGSAPSGTGYVKVISGVFTTPSTTIPYADLTGAPTSLPASDVYSWAKASTKPSYTAAEVGAVADVLIRTVAQGIPNNYTGSTLDITGTLTSDGSTPLVFPTIPFLSLDAQNYPVFSDASNIVSRVSDTLVWRITSSGPPIAQWESSSDAIEPDSATGWTPQQTNTGTPTIVITHGAAYLDADTVGQLCRYGDAFPYRWFIAETAGEGTTTWREIDEGETASSIAALASATFSSDVVMKWASTAAGTRTNLGAGTVGDSLFTAATVTDVDTALGWTTKRLASSETRTSTITPTTVTALSGFSVTSGKKYIFEFLLLVTAPASGGLTFTSAWPTIATTLTTRIGTIMIYTGNPAGIVASSASRVGTTIFDNAAVADSCILKGDLVYIAAGTGSVDFKISQNTSNATATSLLASSFIRMREIP